MKTYVSATALRGDAQFTVCLKMLTMGSAVTASLKFLISTYKNDYLTIMEYLVVIFWHVLWRCSVSRHTVIFILRMIFMA